MPAKEGIENVGGSMMNFEGKTVYLSCGATDMRKSINVLAELLQSRFNLSPFEMALFVFCNRSRDRIKILEWDEDGFWLFFKRLEKGHFRWPQTGDSPTLTLNGEELATLLGGVRVELKLKRREVFERKIS
jgi:transposase